MSSWHSYPKIYALGHRAVAEIYQGVVDIEEKVDGSQFSFGVFDGVVKARSKGKEQVIEAPDALFKEAMETVLRLQPELHDGWTYSGEYLKSPAHNTQTHARIPKQHIILFDIRKGEEDYLSRAELEAEAARLGLEVVPLLGGVVTGVPLTMEDIRKLLETESILGGTKIEGVVLKNRTRFCADGKAMMAKFVSEAFKEDHQRVWPKTRGPLQSEVVDQLAVTFRTHARWDKAVQHLRDDGRLLGEPKDIAGLVKEVQRDVGDECKEAIKEHLWKWAWPKLERELVKGLPQWYKEKLVTASSAEVAA